MQQVAKNLATVNIRRRRRHRMNLFSLAVNANMALHAKAPLVPFPRLIHLRIPPLILILGRARRINNRGIHDCAGIHFQSIILEILVNQGEQLIAQIGRLKQRTKVAYRGFIRRRLVPQVNTHKKWRMGLRVVQGLFH